MEKQTILDKLESFNEQLNLTHYWIILLKYKKVLVVLPLLFGLLGYLIGLNILPIFQSKDWRKLAKKYLFKNVNILTRSPILTGKISVLNILTKGEHKLKFPAENQTLGSVQRAAAEIGPQ